MVSLHAKEYTELLFRVLVPELGVRLPKVADVLLHSHALPAHEHNMVWMLGLLDFGRPGTWSSQDCWKPSSFLISILSLSFHCFTDRSARKSR